MKWRKRMEMEAKIFENGAGWNNADHQLHNKTQEETSYVRRLERAHFYPKCVSSGTICVLNFLSLLFMDTMLQALLLFVVYFGPKVN